MLKKIIAQSEWSQLSAFMTPAFLDVISLRAVLRRVRESRVSASDPTVKQALASRAMELQRLPLAIECGGAATPAEDLLTQDEAGDGQRVVTLYFHQLFSDVPTLLDLRESAFERRSRALHWQPAPWVCRWDRTFITHLRAIYRGFYEGDDGLFRSGLEGLDLGVAEGLFRQHFGADQAAHQFRTSEFLQTFSQVFRRCKEAKVRLHPDFALLGVYLAALYDRLDGRDSAIDVLACYRRALPKD